MKKIFLIAIIASILTACSIGGSVNLNGGSNGVGIGLGVGSSIKF